MLRSVLLCTSAALVLPLFPSPALAQESGESVIVTATRVPTPETEIAGSVTVITAADITVKVQTSLADVLRNVPGLNLVQSGGVGDQASIFMRGTNSNHTKVLYDGIDVSDPSTPNDTFDPGKFAAADIARVEVLRGPQSSLYGSDAVGGVINIITKSGEGPFMASAGIDGGSFGTFDQNAALSGSADGFHYRATLSHIHAGGTPVTPPGLLLPGEKANGDDYDGLSASAKLGYDVTGGFDLGFVGRYSNSLEHITGDGFDPVTFAGFPSPTQSRIDVLQYDTRGTAHLSLWDGRFDQTLGLAYSSVATSYADPNNGYTLTAGNRIKLDWQGNIGLGEGEMLVLGAESARDAIHQPLAAGMTTDAGFAELQSQFGAFGNSVSLRYDDNSRFGDKFTWHIAPVWRIAATGTRLKATLGTGFKAPSLEDLYGPFGHNPALAPETSTGYDIGFDQDLGDFIAAGDLSAGATWFHNDIANLIESGPPPTYAPVNIGRARTQGVETYLAWKPANTLSFRVDYTYTEAEDTLAHTALLRRPADKVSIGGLWQATDALSLDGALLFVGPWNDVGRESFAPVRQSGTVTADIAADYTLAAGFAVFGRISNLFDGDNQNPNGFLQPGRGFYAGLRARL